jgi:hypothetical protein
VQRIPRTHLRSPGPFEKSLIQRNDEYCDRYERCSQYLVSYQPSLSIHAKVAALEYGWTDSATRAIRKRALGIGVIVSHNMPHLCEVADRVRLARPGRGWPSSCLAIIGRLDTVAVVTGGATP